MRSSEGGAVSSTRTIGGAVSASGRGAVVLPRAMVAPRPRPDRAACFFFVGQEHPEWPSSSTTHRGIWDLGHRVVSGSLLRSKRGDRCARPHTVPVIAGRVALSGAATHRELDHPGRTIEGYGLSPNSVPSWNTTKADPGVDR